MRKFAALLALIGLFFSAPAVAQYQLNFRDADIRAVVQDVARVTGKTFIVDERVQVKISIVSDRPLTRSEYFEVFLSSLRANGLIAVPMSNGAYRIQPADGAASTPSKVGGSKSTPANQMVTEVFRLKHIDAAQAVEALRPLISKEGSITANVNGNSVIVVDYGDNMRRIRTLIAEIDVDRTTSVVIPLKNAGAREIASALQTLAGSGGEGRAAPVTVVAIDSSNSIAVRGDATQVGRFAAMARDLDARADSQAEIKVYWLEYADAEQLLPVLQRVLGQPVSSSGSAPEFMSRPAAGASGDGKDAAPATTPAPTADTGGASGTGIAGRGPAVVTRFEGGNAIIVAARPDVQKQLGELIRQLDTPRPQVLVEAIVVELTDDGARELGLQFLFGGDDAPFAATSYSNATPNILTIGGAYAAYELSEQSTVIDGNVVTTTQSSPLGDSLTNAAASQLLGANGGFLGAVFDLGKGAFFGTILNAVQTNTESNVLSTPSIMVLDNQSARMMVGQEVPITTGEALSSDLNNRFRTVDRQNVGVQLEVRPQVNSSGMIKLYVRQEVSSVAGPVSSRSADLVLNKREFQTVLTLEDGQMVVIGGLIDENERRTIEKIPLLGDLPIIGPLFQSKSRAKGKTNLVVFIRPTIIRSRADADALTARRYGYFRQGQMDFDPLAEPSLDVLMRDYMGARPPVDQLRTGDEVYGASGQTMRVERNGEITPFTPPPSQIPPLPYNNVEAQP